jgi:hypothetical protein
MKRSGEGERQKSDAEGSSAGKDLKTTSKNDEAA